MTGKIPPQQFLINGKSDASISPLDRGFAYGDGVFRTMLVNAALPDAWDLHYQKLVMDCNRLGIHCPAAHVLMADIAQIFESQQLAVAKIIISRGISVRGYAINPAAETTRVLIQSPYPHYPAINFSEGIALHLCNLRLAHQPLLAGIKHLNRLENIMARREWDEPMLADGLLMDYWGNVIECTMSNVFARFGNELVTPDLTQCGVEGVTRQRILEACAQLNLQARVMNILLPELLRADEVIICNSLFGAWQVRSVGSRSWKAQGLAKQLREILAVNHA